MKLKSFSFLLITLGTASAYCEIKVNKITKFPAKYGIHKPHGASVCRDDLAKYSISEIPNFTARLKKKGFDCLVGDFDNNGFKDYALLEKGWAKDATALGQTKVYVLFFDKRGYLKTRFLPNEVSIFNFELHAFEKELEPESSSKRIIGFIENGEGGDNRLYYFKNDLFNIKVISIGEEN